ncbi:sensor domain-containing diguanylate cyclase [Stutzerimonas stutzeri]|uniref:sensor domain-containing diguanylate cyclase n=1 Tax=Stutzerimonas stutzeri TaxID=316 RepID=UPI0020C66EFA|nr:diguanylate cyclase [Stutzerimonas stutzeri]
MGCQPWSVVVLFSLLMSVCGLTAAEVKPTLATQSIHGLQVGAIEYLSGHPAADFDTVRGATGDWQPLERPNLQRQPDGAWLRFALRNPSARAGTWYFSLKWPVLDDVRVQLYYPERDRWGPPMRAGDTLPMRERPQPDHNYVFPLLLHAEEGAVVYVHVQSRELIALPLAIADETGFLAGKIADVAMINLFFGGMLVILLYNCSLFVFTRDLSYLLYVTYLLSALFYVLTITGFGQLFLWPEAPKFSHRFYGLSAALCFFTPLVFASRFLDIRRYGGWVWQVTLLLITYWATVLLAILFAPALTRYLAIETMALIHCGLTIAVTVTLWIRGNASARRFTIAWATLLVFTVAHLLALEGVLPLNIWTLNGQLIGMFVEFVLLSMALAERINHERERRIEAQHNALRTSEALAQERESRLRAQQEALQLQMRANEVLEQRVSERTRALEDAKRGLEAVNAQLKRMSTTDALTQLANRGHFDLTLDEEVRRAQRLEQPLSVLLLDIDHFKQVNDTYGHPFGDECLRLVAATLKQRVQRAGELVARYGGEEFVIALPGIDSHKAQQQAERIRQAVAELHPSYGDHRLDLTISIGVATLQPPIAHTPAELLAAADAALYRAKRNGRNQVVVTAPGQPL